MPTTHGDFIWYELMTTQADAAQDFYGALLGWTYADSGQEGVDYRIFSAADAQIGGMLALTAEMTGGGARPAWIGYVHVDDLDKAVEGFKAAGGQLLIGPEQIPDIGPFAMMTDPQGVPLYIMTNTSGEESHAFAKTSPKVGHCAWNELVTSDPDAAKAFYGEQFGWKKDGDLDMGPMGLYEFLKQDDYMLGAVMRKAEEMPVSAWAYYFRVTDIDKAVETVKDKGGQVIVGPQEIPGGEYIINGIDPQGAMFALIGKRG